MKYFIITGTSSGLGESLAKVAIEEKNKVFCISRSMNHDLNELSKKLKTAFWYFGNDLTAVERIPALVNEIFSYVDMNASHDLILINNAGTAEPVKPLAKCEVNEINNQIQLNLVVPLVLSAEFLKSAKYYKGRKFIINITSGAAVNPYYGWSLYCSSKAGVDMMTRVVALEQVNAQNPAVVFSIAPGVLDTPMQTKLRAVDPADFPLKPKFLKLYEDNMLTPPREAAERILQLTDQGAVTSGSIIDLRKL
jgi:benzil reductase ((S)-benzoin forming)